MTQVVLPNKFRKKIQQCDEGVPRPLWSVLIPTHNCAKYLEQTLSSVLVQDLGEDDMEIIVIDDCSTTDNPKQVVETLGKGRVRFISQTTNVGKSKNFQTGLNKSRGFLIHQLHGDDLVEEGFYRSMANAFSVFPEASAFFCESKYINAAGRVIGRTGKESDQLQILEDWLEKMMVAQRIQTPSIVVRREVYESLGGFDFRLPNFEDWEMWVRIATSYKFGFNPNTTAQYRIYSASTSSESILSGKRTEVLKETLSIMDDYLVEDVLTRCRSERARVTAQYLIRCIPQTIDARKPLAWLKLCIETMRFSMHPRELYYLFIFTFHYKRYLN